MEVVSNGLSFPTSLVIAGDDSFYVAESGLPFGGAPPGGRIWHIEPDGSRTLLIDNLRQPVNGLALHEDRLYVSEGGHPGRISRFDKSGQGRQVILDNLPGPGNYHTNMTAFGPDGKLYFSQGAMTNTGIVGLDSCAMAWLRRLPHACDVPGYDITLAGVNVETPNPLSNHEGARASTGGFVPFGQPSLAGQRIPAQLPCTAAVLRCSPNGSELELVAWGLRNAYGLGFLADGMLLAVDQGADDRGSRPVGNVPDMLFAVRNGAWYGWPDFIGNVPITDPRFCPENGAGPDFLLANHDELPVPEPPLVSFPPHSSAGKFDVADGQVFVTLFGDEVPLTAPSGPKVGRSVIRIDSRDWSLHRFVQHGLLRPIDVKLHAGENALYILDFGYFEMLGDGSVDAKPGSGKIWRCPL